MGYAFSLLCAVFWSLSLILFKSFPALPAARTNFLKNSLSLLFIFPTFWLATGRSWPSMSWHDASVLLASGCLGVGIADVLVLRALAILPAGVVSLLECLYSPFVLLLSMTFLGERLSEFQAIGGVMILIAVALVTHGHARSDSVAPKALVKGILLMTLALLMIASAVVMIKPVLSTVAFWDIIVVRMIAGVASSGLISFFDRSGPSLRSVVTTPRKSLTLVAACLSGSYISLIFWVAGFSLLKASVAAFLNQTSTVFTLIFAAVFLNESFTTTRMGAVALAGLGIALISFS